MGPGEWGSTLAGSGFQKLAFVALFVLMMGVTSGWLGGL